MKLRWQAKMVYILLLLASDWAGAQVVANQQTVRDTQMHGYWIDPSTGLMWAGRDNGRDVSWRGAIKYCHSLRLADYSDWRLANMFELQPLYDRAVESPGTAGPGKGRVVAWHVKGGLFLTGDQWANNSREDGRSSGYEYYFDFNDGRSNDNPVGWPYPHAFIRALCVRGTGDPLAGQRPH